MAEFVNDLPGIAPQSYTETIKNMAISLRTSALWLLAGLLLVGFGFVVRTSLMVPYHPGQSLTVTASGKTLQGKQPVAHARASFAGSELRIPLVTPDTASEAVSTDFILTFAQDDASSVVNLEPVSIQGNAGIHFIWQDDHTLQVFLDNLLPESSTILLVRAPEGFF